MTLFFCIFKYCLYASMYLYASIHFVVGHTNERKGCVDKKSRLIRQIYQLQ